MRNIIAAILFLLLHAGPAAADLYRWIDPETRSIKFSSYPPPWYGEGATQRGPKVEVIPARDASGRPGSAGKAQEGNKTMDSLDTQRKAILQQLPALAARPGSERSGSPLQRQFEIYTAVIAQMDKLDPQGAAARRGELEMVIQKISKEDRSEK